MGRLSTEALTKDFMLNGYERADSADRVEPRNPARPDDLVVRGTREHES